MDKTMKWALALSILAVIFAVNLSGHITARTPLHVDSWIVLSEANAILKGRAIPAREPFSGTPLKGPVGNPVLQAALSSINGLELLKGAVLLPGFLNVVLALMMYALSMQLFGKPMVAITVAAFEPLVLSQITMLGPYFLVNLSIGMVLSLLCFYFLLKERWGFFLLGLAAVDVVHISSMVFVLIATGLYIAFNPRHWARFSVLLIAVLLSVLAFLGMRGRALMGQIFSNFLMFDKVWPYFRYLTLLGPVFLALLAYGFYSVSLKESKARAFLLPIFIFMALDMSLYWFWHGFLLVYRRLISFIFLLGPFFIGYGVYSAVRGRKTLLVVFLCILLPFAVSQNIAARTPYIVYISPEENLLFKGFGILHPGARVLTGHLEAYALPYYNLSPVSLSPAHGANSSYFWEIAPCYSMGDLECIARFFNSTGFRYLYTDRPINSSQFIPVAAVGSHVIYKTKNLYSQTK